MRNKLTPLFLLLLLGFIWGTGYSIARFATTHGVPPMGYSFWQSLGPAILISLLVSATHREKNKTTVSHLRYYFICGLAGIVIPNTNMYFAAPHLPAGLLAVIVNIVPIVVYPMALLARVEKFDSLRLLGVAFAVTGLMFFTIPHASLPSTDTVPWILSTLITPLSFAFCAVYIARYRPANADSLSLSAGTLIAASLILMPFVIFTGNFYKLHLPFTTPDGVIVLEIILSSVGYILFFQLIKIAGPLYYSLIDTVVSMTGLFWGYVLFHERLNTFTSTGIILILLALLLVTKQQRAAVQFVSEPHQSLTL
jgi:drug/metabolite transporter (DMT)-like permease